MKTLTLWLALLLPLFAMAAPIPAGNQIDWTPHTAGGAGVVGGIPDTSGWTVVNVTLPPYSAAGNGVADDTAKINQAITDAGSGGTKIYLPGNGDDTTRSYRTTSSLLVNTKTNVLIIGDGFAASGVPGTAPTPRTRIYMDAGSTPGDVIKIFRGSTSFTGINITSTPTKGLTTITVADATSIAVNDLGYISQTNDPSVTNNTNGNNSTWTGVPNSVGTATGTRVLAQIVRVTAKSGNDLTISPALMYTYNATYDPEFREETMFSGCGVEDLQTYRVAVSSDYQSTNGVYIGQGINCWVRNIQTRHSYGAGVRFERAFHGEAQWVDMRDGFDNSSGHNYGVFAFGVNSNLLIEHCIADNLRHDYIHEGSDAGTVVGYNYGQDAQGSEDAQFLHGALDGHSRQAIAKLWEGNITTKLTPDNTFGASAFFNTMFRNWVTIVGTNITFTRGLYGIDIQQNSYSNAVVGNVVGKSGQTGPTYQPSPFVTDVRATFRLGWPGPGASGSATDANVAATTVIHRTYSFNAAAIISANNAGLDAALPASLYYATRPSWATKWWPIFDPDYPTNAAIIDLPAGLAFSTGSLTGYPNYTPTSFDAASASTTQINLTWTDTATGETGFFVERSADGSTGWTQIGTAAANATSYNDTGLSPSTTYYYRVAAYRGATTINSPYSATDSATTGNIAVPVPGMSGKAVLSGKATIR